MVRKFLLVGVALLACTVARAQTVLTGDIYTLQGNTPVGVVATIPANIQPFGTAGGTWTKPANVGYCTAYLMAGGGSGGGGATVASSGSGGASGASGAWRVIGPFAASGLPPTAAVTVGAGGGQVAAGANGNQGGNTVGITDTTVRDIFDVAGPVVGGAGSFNLKAKPSATAPSASDYSETLTVIASASF